MAMTYSWGELMNILRTQIPNSTEDIKATAICNMALTKIWTAYNWRESLVPLPPFYLVPNEQIYSAPAAIVPSNFMGLFKAYYVSLRGNPAMYNELRIIRDIRETQASGPPNQIGYVPEKSGFMVYPRVPDGGLVAPTDFITGVYKKSPTKVTPATIASTYPPYDDTYLPHILEVLRWAGFSLAGDKRAIEQLKLAEQSIDHMAGEEGLLLGEPTLAPSEGLSSSVRFEGYPYSRIY